MAGWEYRICRHRQTLADGGEQVWYALHEVYHEAEASDDPVTFVADEPQEIELELRKALSAAMNRPIFDIE